MNTKNAIYLFFLIIPLCTISSYSSGEHNQMDAISSILFVIVMYLVLTSWIMENKFIEHLYKNYYELWEKANKPWFYNAPKEIKFNWFKKDVRKNLNSWHKKNPLSANGDTVARILFTAWRYSLYIALAILFSGAVVGLVIN